MGVLDIWWVQVIIYLIATVVFTGFFKITTKKSKNDAALTVLLEIMAGIVLLCFMPLFEFKLPTDKKVYIISAIAVIFYAIKDRLDTTVRKNLEASTVNILEQSMNVFLIVWGLLFFKEPFVWKKIIGAILIIFSNVLLMYQKGKFEFNKYVLLKILGSLSISIAISLDVGISDNYNVALYKCLTLVLPALLIFIFERVKIKDIKEEFKICDKKAIFITSISWGIMILSQLRAMQLGMITTVAPLCAITVILNVFAGYLFLNEKDNLIKKIIAAIIVIFSITLIK